MDDTIKDKFENYISNYIKKDHINHAYLLETNVENKLSLAELIAEKINSFNSNISLQEMKNNNDYYVISTDSNLIKTEEIELLKEKFMTKSIYGNKRIYVIVGAEKLNDYAANKLLKFIEEPEEDIYAILVTDNKNKVINTIVSRCQILKFVVLDNKFSEYGQDYIDELFRFVLNIENNKETAIAYQDSYDIKKLSDRKYIQDFLNNMLYIYDDVIKYKVDHDVDYFKSEIEKIKIIDKKNDIDDLRRKIYAINTCISRLKFNPNIKLLIDKLIILMTGVE